MHLQGEYLNCEPGPGQMGALSKRIGPGARIGKSRMTVQAD